MKAEGPTLHPDMLTTVLTGVAAFTCLFVGMMILRYGLERVEARLNAVEATS